MLLIFKIQISHCSQEIESMETLGEPTSSFGWLEPVEANPPWYIPKRKGYNNFQVENHQVCCLIRLKAGPGVEVSALGSLPIRGDIQNT